MTSCLRPLCVTAFAACVAASALAAEPPAPAAPDDGVAVSAELRKDLLIEIVLLGLDRGRSDRKEDLDRIACVRDKKPGTRFARLRCATNRDWNKVAAASVGRATFGGGGYRGLETGNGAVAPSVTSHLALPGLVADPDTGVLDISTKLLLGVPDDAKSRAERTTRIRALLTELSVGADAADPDVSVEELMRFAALHDQVQSLDDAQAEAAIGAAGFTVERYNALATRLETDAAFRTRVRRAAFAQVVALAL